MASLEKNRKFPRFYVLNSIVAPPCVLSICITVLIVFTTKEYNSKLGIVGHLTEPLITLLSMILTFFIWISVKQNTKRNLIEKQGMDVTLNFKLIFLWVFGLACIFDSALDMVQYIDSVFLNDGCQSFPTVEYIIAIAISFVEICFFVGQLGFLSLYGKFSFRPSRLINFGASLMIVTHLLRLFKIPFESVYWRTYDFHFDWNSTSNTTLQHDCRHFSSILFLILEVFEYINSLRIEYHLLSVVIIVKMFADVFSYDRITTFLEEDFQETSIDTETATEDINSSVMLTRQTSTFAVLKSGIVYSLLISLVITYILAFFKTSTINSAKIFLIISTIFETTVLALLLFGKWKTKSHFHESFIKKMPSSGYQTIFICITSGAVAFETFGGIVGLMKADNFFCFLLFLNKILHISVITIQSEFILHTKTISFQSRPVQDKYIRAYRIFQSIFVMNISKWFVSTIVMGKKTDASFIERQFYGDLYWDIIKYTIFPINVFYIFLTSIEMYGLYQNTNIHS